MVPGGARRSACALTQYYYSQATTAAAAVSFQMRARRPHKRTYNGSLHLVRIVIRGPFPSCEEIARTDTPPLGSSQFIARDLAAGRLVNPFGPVLHDDYAYYIVCPLANLDRPEVRGFRDWLIDQSE